MTILAPPNPSLPTYTTDTRAASMPPGFRERLVMCEQCWQGRLFCLCDLIAASYRVDPDEAESLGARERVRRWLGWWR